jgi:hypothetical protein
LNLVTLLHFFKSDYHLSMRNRANRPFTRRTFPARTTIHSGQPAMHSGGRDGGACPDELVHRGLPRHFLNDGAWLTGVLTPSKEYAAIA